MMMSRTKATYAFEAFFVIGGKRYFITECDKLACMDDRVCTNCGSTLPPDLFDSSPRQRVRQSFPGRQAAMRWYAWTFRDPDANGLPAADTLQIVRRKNLRLQDYDADYRIAKWWRSWNWVSDTFRHLLGKHRRRTPPPAY